MDMIGLCEGDRAYYGRVDFDAQSDAQKVFSAIRGLESQVNNGGFNLLYFYNSDSEIIEYAPVALSARVMRRQRQSRDRGHGSGAAIEDDRIAPAA
jgi:hypothetical protein